MPDDLLKPRAKCTLRRPEGQLQHRRRPTAQGRIRHCGDAPFPQRGRKIQVFTGANQTPRLRMRVSPLKLRATRTLSRRYPNCQPQYDRGHEYLTSDDSSGLSRETRLSPAKMQEWYVLQVRTDRDVRDDTAGSRWQSHQIPRMKRPQVGASTWTVSTGE